MSNKNLTDSEIIKALEDYKNSKILQTENGVISIGDILDLINRLQAENEKTDRAFKELIEVARLWKEKYNNAKAENERLKDFASSKCEDCAGCTSWKCDCSNIKAEAYKEFADLSIKRICEQVSAPTPSESYIVEKCNQTIDNLLKELVGADK